MRGGFTGAIDYQEVSTIFTPCISPNEPAWFNWLVPDINLL